MFVEKEQITIDLGKDNKLEILEKLQKFTGKNSLKFQMHGLERMGVSITSAFRLNIRTSSRIFGQFGIHVQIALKRHWNHNQVLNRLIQVLEILVEHAQDTICKNEDMHFK